MKKRVVYIVVLLFLFCACQSNKKKQVAKQNSAVEQSHNETTSSEQVLSYQLPEPPAMLVDEDAKKIYIAKHFWENYNVMDTTLLRKEGMADHLFFDYVKLLYAVPQDDAIEGIKNFLHKLDNVPHKVFKHFMGLSENYFYHPDSQFKNDEFYIPVLEYMIGSPQLDEAHKILPKSRLKNALKNRPNSLAANFKYVTDKGEEGTLYSLKSDYIILFFNNPGCHGCKYYSDKLENSSVVTDLLRKSSKNSSLKILALYPDIDLDEWKKESYPSQWINAYNPGARIMNEELYNLKAIPSLYLLDKDKHVIIKDAVSVEQIEAYLVENAKF